MKKLSIMAFLMALVLCIPQIAVGQSSKETFRSLKKLEAKIQVGISHKEYGPALGDAKFEVNLFSESAEAKDNPRLKEIFNKTMGHYQVAANVWGSQFAKRGVSYNMVPSEQGGTDSDLINQVLRSYPKARTKLDWIGCLPYSEAIKIIRLLLLLR